jgi:hypothetical protein
MLDYRHRRAGLYATAPVTEARVTEERGKSASHQGLTSQALQQRPLDLRFSSNDLLHLAILLGRYLHLHFMLPLPTPQM